MRFEAAIGRSEAGSVRVDFRNLTGGGTGEQLRSVRELGARIYDLAAALEREASDLGALWCVSPEVFKQRLTVELTQRDGDKADEVEKVVRRLMARTIPTVEVLA